MAIHMKQRPEQNAVGFRKSRFEPPEPLLHVRSDGFRASQHSRSQAVDLRGVFSPDHLIFFLFPGKLAFAAQRTEHPPKCNCVQEYIDGCRGDVDFQQVTCAC